MELKRKVHKAERDANLVEAKSSLAEVQDSVAFYGLTMNVFGHKPGQTPEWQFFGEGRPVLKYWPTTKNSMDFKTNEYRVLSGPEEAMELAIDKFFAQRKVG